MKLSERTLAVLNNFASINSGVVLKPGKVQKTISAERSILAEATLDDDFPVEFGIYDLNQFLGLVTTLKNPELTFTKEEIVLTDTRMSFNYRACAASLIISPPDKELTLKDVNVDFDLGNDQLAVLLKTARMTSLPNLTVRCKNNELGLQTHERANDASNYGYMKLGEMTNGSKDFVASFKTENLRLIPDDYHVEVQVGAFAKFENKSKNLTYFIALETK
jgi:hypothetical protein